ncbi:MAG: 4-hydroxy-tetrahydrodipicolinate reductase [Alphaproteobacteria bacterium]|nr:4-hydroxy-tetrahydrodipicolinate reductase [Alphaproteobacteria bacterium]
MKIGVVGAAGRMGRMLVRQAGENRDCALAGATERPDSEAVGQDAGMLAGIGEIGVAVGDDAAAMIAHVDAVIDFTAPGATVAHAALAAQAGAAMVIGTTGLADSHMEALRRAARHVPVVVAPNMSAGVTLLMALVEQVARTLDDTYDIEIFEMHHRHKVDAPSGTALGLGRAAAAGRDVDLDAVARMAREGHTGARPRGEIGFATLRGGDVVGDHTVVFAGDGERIELTHKASSRQVFAAGAVRAALWTRGKPPGLYAMRDVLGLKA